MAKKLRRIGAISLLGGFICWLVFSGLRSTQAATRVIYVDGDSLALSPDGSRWELAYPTLQDALTAVGVPASGEVVEIWLADGHYYPDEGQGQVDNTYTSTFRLETGIQLYGGFEGLSGGQETSRDARDWERNLTILSGDLEQNDVLDVRGILTNAVTASNLVGTNANHVVDAEATSAATVVDGIVITAGRAVATGRTFGAGIFAFRSDMVVRNTLLSGNYAQDRGGGIDANGGTHMVIENVIFHGNRAGSSTGGGLFTQGDPLLVNVQFIGNASINFGGGYSSVSNGRLVNVAFRGNRSGGGAAYYFSGGQGTLTNVTFSGNRSSSGAGAVFVNGNLTFQNCIFWNNQNSVDTQVLSATLFVNTGQTAFENCVVPGSGGSDSWNSYFGLDNGGNLGSDPLFRQPVSLTTGVSFNGDLRLQPTSPAVDSGSNSVFIDSTNLFTPTVASIQTDLQGAARIQNGVIDQGAYEIGSITVAPLTLTLQERAAGEQLTFSLGELPSDLVQVGLSTTNGECVVTPLTVTLDAQTWQQGVTATVTAVDDALEDGTQPCGILTAAAISSDPLYDEVDPLDVDVVVLDIRYTRVYLPLVMTP